MAGRVYLEPSQLSQWLEHPVTKVVLHALEDRNITDNMRFIQTSRLNTEPHVLERTLYRLNGKSEIIRNVTSFDKLKEVVLKDYVIWK